MENQYITDNLKPDDDNNQRSDQNPSSDKKDPPPQVEIEAKMKGGEDFPGLKFHSSVFMKNNIVLFGGRDQKWKENNLFNIFDLETETWSQKTLKGESNAIPKPRWLHTANAVGDFIYIIGGSQRGSIDKNIYQIDFDTQMCQIIGEIREPVRGHTANVHNRNIYLFGGYSQYRKYLSIIQKFNLLTNECEQIDPIGYQPEGRGYHKSIIVQDSLYIFGGVSSKYYQDMFSIDLSNNKFTQIDQQGLIPSPRCHFSFFAFDDELYLFGGNSEDGVRQDFHSFNLKTSSWKLQDAKNEKYLLKRAFHSTVVVKKSSRKLRVYLIGGEDVDEDVYKNMNIITLSSNRIFWVLHYLESTGIHNLPGYCLIQEIIELFE